MAAIELPDDRHTERIIEATEEILEKTGLRVMHKGLRNIARHAGAIVDNTTETVRIPAALLRELLSHAPSMYTIHSLNGTAYEVGKDSAGIWATITDPWVIDYSTGKPRKPGLEDIRRNAAIVQSMDRVAMIYPMDFPVGEVQGPSSSLHVVEELLLRCNKHITPAVANMESYDRWAQIANLLRKGGDPANGRILTIGVAVVSPLIVSNLNAELLLAACRDDFAVVPTLSPMAGTTGPYSIYGNLLQGNIEVIFMAALTQIVKRGHPFLYHLVPSVTDLRSGHDLYYTLDKCFWKLGTVELARHYGLPVNVEFGGTLNVPFDQQGGAEGMVFMLSAYRSSPDMFSGLGSCLNANGISSELMLVQAAWLDAARSLGRGIETDDFRLGVDSIKNAGSGGNFMVDDLTMQFLRSDEFFASAVFDYSGGYESGRSMLDLAHEEVERLVAEFESPVLGDVQEDLRCWFHNEYARLS